MSLAQIHAEIDAQNRAIVYEETWGHLRAEVGRKYPGSLVFVQCVYSGSFAILRREFEIEDSPWFFEAMQDYLFGLEPVNAGTVYRFDGWYRECRNGAHQFVGKVREIRLP